MAHLQMRYREGAKDAKLREVARRKKQDLFLTFAQLRVLRAFAVKFFGLRAEFAPRCFAVDLFGESRFLESSLPGGQRLFQRCFQRVANAIDLPLGHAREERQRQRPGGDVFAIREIALFVAQQIGDVRQ